LHTVTNSQYRTGFYAVENLIRLGYRRIGYIADENFNIRTGGHFHGGYLSARAQFRIEELPVLNLEPMTTSDDVPYWNQARPWIESARPDVILSASGHFVSHLKRWGFKVPVDIGLASLAVEENSNIISGMHQNARNVGRAGVNLVVSLMESQETGIPKTPMHVLIEGIWRDGETTRKVPSQKVAAKSQTNRPRLK
jgi:LacI family transcriptional regulator